MVIQQFTNANHRGGGGGGGRGGWLTYIEIRSLIHSVQTGSLPFM